MKYYQTMKYYIIYFINYKNRDNVNIKELYRSKEDAILNVEKVAIEYIRNLQGKQQADICKQQKSPQDILNDINLKEGFYVLVDNYVVTLYEKISAVVPGKLWNSYELQINKIGLFDYTEYNFDDLLFRSTCTCSIGINKRKINHLPENNFKQLTFVDELKDKIKNNTIKLNHVTFDKGRSVDCQVEDINVSPSIDVTEIISSDLNDERILDLVLKTDI